MPIGTRIRILLHFVSEDGLQGVTKPCTNQGVLRRPLHFVSEDGLQGVTKPCTNQGVLRRPPALRVLRQAQDDNVDGSGSVARFLA